jgi:radical SAM protein with 4Fe4S-binding SPASM domain
VYTRQHYIKGITPQTLIEHFLSLGVRGFHIPPAIGAWHGVDTFAELAQVTELYVDAVRRSIQSYRTSSPYFLRGIQFVLDGFAIRERRRYVCGAGRTFMGVNYDGEAFPCYLLQSPEVSYGFIDDGWDQTRYNRIRRQFEANGKAHHPVCRECWANEICQSCLGVGWQLSPEIAKPPAWFCGFQKALIGVVLAEIASARESSDWTLFQRNWEAHLAPLLSPEEPAQDEAGTRPSRVTVPPRWMTQTSGSTPRA